MGRTTLTADQIVRTAIELLDEEGLEGLNMRALGKQLGGAATAVYWHVKNKDDLVLLAGDQVWHEIDLPDPDGGDWRAAAAQLATGLYSLFTRHPWLVQAFGSYLFYGPGKARFDDCSLAVYEAAGFPEADADRAAAAVFTYALGNALGAAATAALTRRLNRGGSAAAAFDATVAKASEVAERFPRLRRRLHTPAAEYNAAPDNTFEYGLHTLLNGLAAELGIQDASATRSTTTFRHPPASMLNVASAQVPSREGEPE